MPCLNHSTRSTMVAALAAHASFLQSHASRASAAAFSSSSIRLEHETVDASLNLSHINAEMNSVKLETHYFRGESSHEARLSHHRRLAQHEQFDERASLDARTASIAHPGDDALIDQVDHSSQGARSTAAFDAYKCNIDGVRDESTSTVITGDTLFLCVVNIGSNYAIENLDLSVEADGTVVSSPIQGGSLSMTTMMDCSLENGAKCVIGTLINPVVFDESIERGEDPTSFVARGSAKAKLSDSVDDTPSVQRFGEADEVDQPMVDGIAVQDKNEELEATFSVLFSLQKEGAVHIAAKEVFPNIETNGSEKTKTGCLLGSVFALLGMLYHTSA